MDPPERIYLLNENTLVVVNPKGKMKVINTPFKVLCVKSNGLIKNSRWYSVTKVTGKDNALFFTINKEVYSHSHFHIYFL